MKYNNTIQSNKIHVKDEKPPQTRPRGEEGRVIKYPYQDKLRTFRALYLRLAAAAQHARTPARPRPEPDVETI